MAVTEAPLTVELAYALPAKQVVELLHLEPGVTAREALRFSALPAQFPDLDIAVCPLGVFGQVVADSYVLQAGDRLEIYRPLINEPRETRRRLAAEGKTMGSGKRNL
jgi:putative ubiquitin-RnfH superfamily antitoxin RatB of RatAB toxin-antitoxin module